VPITRHGRREEVYWTYSYSPIDDALAPNGIGGVLVVCSETTRQVQGAQRLAAALATTAARDSATGAGMPRPTSSPSPNEPPRSTASPPGRT
jgi:hypothetical protein